MVCFMKKSQFPFHTILLSLYPIAFLASQNLRFIQLEDTIRSFAISLGFACLFLISFRIILKDWAKSGAICSLIVILFFLFGHVVNVLSAQGVNLISTVYLGWIWGGIFLVLSFIVLRVKPSEDFTKSLNMISALLLVIPLGSILISRVPLMLLSQQGKDSLSELRKEAVTEQNLPKLSSDEKPDIYYIILDSYERADKLQAFYNYDNSAFINTLEQRGFYIVSSGRSNYLNTTYSLNTSLNLLYFHKIPDRAFFNALSNLNTNHVTDFLRSQGYQIVVFQSGTGDSDKQYADIFVSSPTIQKLDAPVLNPFEQFLIKTTLGRLLFRESISSQDGKKPGNAIVASINRGLSIRRERISHAFTHLPDFAAKDGNHYLFAHIYLPHIPFLYEKDGEPLLYHENTSLYWYEPEPENYRAYYAYQIEYVNKQVLLTIDKILQQSTGPVVIIVQADHGDGNYLDRDNLDQQGVDIRSAILNAIYFSDNSYSELYPTMTPVNTFRAVFNHWFGTNYLLLPDQVYANEHPSALSSNKKPYFKDGCAEFNICIPPNPGTP